MKKKVFTLDADEAAVSFADVALSFWQTAMVGFEFAHSLNRIYRLDLERMADLQPLPGSTAWPHYAYHDHEAKLQYHILDKPFSAGTLHPAIDTSDKVLIVSGRDAWDMTARMADDATRHHPEGTVAARLAADVFAVQTFNFDPTSAHCTPPSRQMAALKTLCESILAALDL